ncbi:MAG: SDR family oxidoreductase [bacterium]|nr:SDR family oxidoreductase [bacterium]
MRRALVTGSARGIGAAIAARLAAAGHEVIGVDQTEHAADYLSATIRADLADASTCAQLFAELPPVDILVNNAAVLVDRPLEETSIEDIDRLLAINLRAPILLAKAALPGMVERHWGRVINLSSVGARTGGYAASGVYNTTKAGLISFSKYVARHYGPMGITANAIAPGGIRTEMMKHLSEDQFEEYRALIPVGYLGSPQDVAEAAAFLVSDQAAYINGVTLDVNGGWVMA